MTVNELVEHIADAINQTSPEAKARIGRELNVRYKQVTSAIGLITSRREEFTKLATIGSEFLTFTGTEKLDAVYRKVGTKKILLDELTKDEMLEDTFREEPPTTFCIYSLGPASVTIKMDCIPISAFTLYADGLADVSTLTNINTPAFPESFHDILIHGVMADEYKRREKMPYAKEEEQIFTQRLSDLKMFIAKSAYLDIYRGKLTPSEGWWDDGGSK